MQMQLCQLMCGHVKTISGYHLSFCIDIPDAYPVAGFFTGSVSVFDFQPFALVNGSENISSCFIHNITYMNKYTLNTDAVQEIC